MPLPPATLVVAKLDRLSPNVAFVSALMESGVEFVAADMPTVKRLTVDIPAAVAEEEARLISVRTKAALAAAKARGVQLGNPQLRAGTADQARAATAAKVDKARTRAATCCHSCVKLTQPGPCLSGSSPTP